MRTGFLMLVFAGLLGPAGAQTLAEVQKAVQGYFGDDASAQAAQHSLADWGDAALPFLRTLAGTPGHPGPLARGDEWNLVCSLKDVDTSEAIEFLIEMLDDKTALDPRYALNGLFTEALDHADQLRPHVRFQQLVFMYAKGGDWPTNKTMRKQAGYIIGQLGWRDGESLLEAMLQEEDYSIRQAGAECIAMLDGRAVEISKPALAFPGSEPGDELSLVLEVPNAELQGRLEPWFDGKPAVIAGRRGELTASRAAGQPPGVADFSWRIGNFLAMPAPDASARWVLLVSENSGYRSSDLAICVDAARDELWRFVPRRKGIAGLCRLYDASGCVGVAFGPGGDEGAVGFDAAGAILFRVPARYTVYELSSNPRVPDRWLLAGGGLEVFDNRGRSVGAGRFDQPSGGYFFARHAVLAQDDGQPIIVAGGSASDSNPAILCCDVKLGDVWRATVPDPIQGLALLQPPTGEARLVAAIESGELLVFDLHGALRQRLLLPAREENRESRRGTLPVSSMSAGPLPDGGYGVAVGMKTSTAVYLLRQ